MIANKVFLVYKHTLIDVSYVVKIFKEEKDAADFCDKQNEINKPEFDEWGYVGGVYHTYTWMKVE